MSVENPVVSSAEAMTEQSEFILPTLDEIVSLCKRTGFVFLSSEIYGGLAAVYDYGPYGVELAENVKKEWRKEMVQRNPNIVGLDAGIFMKPRVWEASGHVDGFSDPLVECRDCNARLRVDHLLEEVGVKADDKMEVDEISELFHQNRADINCPNCGKSDFTDVKNFNLLVTSNLGNVTGDLSRDPVYLRGETCQGIYVNYKNILDSSRLKIPFGVAQVGKAFRNEITARQFIFRTREFEQMEMQLFVEPGTDMEAYEVLRAARMDYYIKRLGISSDNLRWHEHDKLAFYAKAAYDIEYRYPFGFAELEGVHARGDYDLTQHSKFSGVDLNYFDPHTRNRYTPHVIEASVGVGRTMLALLTEAYTKEEVGDKTRLVMKFPATIAPVKAAVLPLVRNNSELVERAQNIYKDLREEGIVEFAEGGSIGKRYRIQDEIGTPMCVTVDYATLEEGTVTVRDRDTMLQETISAENLRKFVRDKLSA
jgi:glycyl-tRNA synthetase